MKLMSEIVKDLAIGEKILIFCSSINEMKNIGESLKCCVYYSKSDLKELSLKDWENGVNKIMIMTNALGAGMNISNMMMMIYIRNFFEYISFI